MRVLIVGGGKVGSHLASLLLADGYEVCVVENRSSVLARLYRELPTEAVMDGDGTQMFWSARTSAPPTFWSPSPGTTRSTWPWR